MTATIEKIKKLEIHGELRSYHQKNFNNVNNRQYIFEVVDKIPTMLPRKLDETGMMVVTEHFENGDKIRKLSISPERLRNALKWLIANNPLYKDVRIDENVCSNFNRHDKGTHKPKSENHRNHK